jgi:hypothetical protein
MSTAKSVRHTPANVTGSVLVTAAEQQIGFEQATSRQRSHEPEHEANPAKPGGLNVGETPDISGLRPNRHPDADLPPALRD